MDRVRVTIIGAGIVGLAIGAALAEKYDGIYILEKNWKFGLEGSTHNSGVIHSGIHYPPGSLKARLCVRGNRMLYDICSKNGIKFRRTGKLTVSSWEEREVLEKLRKQGEENGVVGMRILQSEEISRMEPMVRADVALFTPSSGIVDQDALLSYFYSRFIWNGGVLITESKVDRIERREGGYEISGLSRGGKFSFLARTVVNSAGLYADAVAMSAGIDIDAQGYRMEYWKGDYYRIDGAMPISTLIYPIPENEGLGIHLTPDPWGTFRLGPNSYHVNDINFTVETSADVFKKEAGKYIPSIRNYALSPDFSGIRPKLRGKGFRDFVIKEESDIGFEGFINLLGIESPGLTAAPAIAEFVLDTYSKMTD
ncbi:MAG: NAD(P)/FAD-dependent oxidoreductase [Thermoplasmata archaeon]